MLSRERTRRPLNAAPNDKILLLFEPLLPCLLLALANLCHCAVRTCADIPRTFREIVMEPHVNDEALALILTLAILAAIFFWVPTLNFCGERCQRFLHARRKSRAAASPETAQGAGLLTENRGSGQ